MTTRSRLYTLFSLGLVFLIFFVVRAYAAEISNVVISNITDGSATVTWDTDVPTDATINFGLDSRVGTIRDPLFDKKEHSLTIDQLDPSTTYHFRVISADTVGNKSATAGFVFTTKGTTDSSRVEKIIKEIDEITDPEEIAKIQDKVKEVANDILKAPAIVGPPKVVPGSETTEIVWTTDRDSNSMVYFAPEGEYSPGRTNPYTLAQGDPKNLTTKHKVTIRGLAPSTVYHFIVSSEDSGGLLGESEDETFRTKSILPDIENIKVSRVQETAATISWSTNGVLAKGLIEYTNTRTKATKSAGNPVYAANQSIQLTGLEFGAKYSAVIRAMNEGGDEVSSNPITFVTVRDVVAPAISKVNNESTLYPGEETKIQTIVAWETDEPATCQVFYSQGLARQAGDEGDALPAETNPVTTHTQVIVGFASATVYQFWVICNDEAKNESRSEDFVLITPIKEKSIIDIILENFQGTFGWVNNIGK
ncbi:MAG: fibronectin type III domain-containing protein [Minisyncoccia bacterium]